MFTTNRGQNNNRYLESPYIVKDTASDTQVPFSVENPINGGVLFSSEGFSTKPPTGFRSHEEDEFEPSEILKEIEEN